MEILPAEKIPVPTVTEFVTAAVGALMVTAPVTVRLLVLLMVTTAAVAPPFKVIIFAAEFTLTVTVLLTAIMAVS